MNLIKSTLILMASGLYGLSPVCLISTPDKILETGELAIYGNIEVEKIDSLFIDVYKYKIRITESIILKNELTIDLNLNQFEFYTGSPIQFENKNVLIFKENSGKNVLCVNFKLEPDYKIDDGKLIYVLN